jgi:hypothetical protein
MTKEGLTEIVLIVDKSGSMMPKRSATIEGYNKFLADQRGLPGEMAVTTVLFDTVMNTLHDRKALDEVKDLTEGDYQPDGYTALLDAVGHHIDTLGHVLSNTPEADRPSQIIFVIITDGEENSSKEYSWAQVKEKIIHQQEKYGWEFIYLGAHADAFQHGGALGIQEAGIAKFVDDGIGVDSAFAVTSDAVQRTRAGGKVADMVMMEELAKKDPRTKG